MCASFLSSTHRSLKNGMPGEYNKPSKIRRVRGCTLLQQCRQHCWTSCKSHSRWTNTTGKPEKGLGYVFSSILLFPNVFPNHHSKTAHTALSEKVSRHHLVPYSKEQHPLLSALSHRCSLVHPVPNEAYRRKFGCWTSLETGKHANSLESLTDQRTLPFSMKIMGWGLSVFVLWYVFSEAQRTLRIEYLPLEPIWVNGIAFSYVINQRYQLSGGKQPFLRVQNQRLLICVITWNWLTNEVRIRLTYKRTSI